MKHLLAGCCVAALLTGAASAADLGGSLKDGPMSFSDGKAISWTGVYVGGQIGYGNSNHNLNATETLPAVSAHRETIVTCSNGGALSGTSGCTEVPSTISVPGTGSNNNKCYLASGSQDTSAHVDGGKCMVSGSRQTTTIDVPDIAASAANMFIDGLNSSGVFGGGTVGADLQRGRLVFGVFGDYNISDAKMTAGADFNGDNVFSASIEDGNSWLVAGRIGYLVTDRAMLYGLGGYGQQDVTYKVAIPGDSDHSGSLDTTFSGWVVGGGAEYALSHNVFVGLEYQHFFGGKETLVDDGTHLVTDELDTDKVMAKVKIKFGN